LPEVRLESSVENQAADQERGEDEDLQAQASYDYGITDLG
jgi:hypothetical protein